MAANVILFVLIMAAVIDMVWLLWLAISWDVDRQDARQRHTDYVESMAALEAAAGNPEPVKRIQEPKPKPKPMKRFTVRRKHTKIIYQWDIAEPDRQKEGRDGTDRTL